jgi:hypothetical protein
MECKTCPVVDTIKNIKSGGLYTDYDGSSDDDTNSTNNTIKVGGEGKEYVCDNVSYVTNLRLIDYARFKLARPSLEEYAEKFTQLFDHLLTKSDELSVSYNRIYLDIIERSLMWKYIHEQFIKIVQMIGLLEKHLLKQVISGKNYNISLPSLIIPPDANVKIIYSPGLLTIFVNKIINYVNGLNIPGVVKKKVAAIESFTDDIDLNKNITFKLPKTIDEYDSTIRKLLDAEVEITIYLHKLELYHCKIINATNELFAQCKLILA